MMKHHYFPCAAIVLSLGVFAACQSQPTPPSQNGKQSKTDPSRRTYTEHDLDRSGRTDNNEALKHIDPNL